MPNVDWSPLLNNLQAFGLLGYLIPIAVGAAGHWLYARRTTAADPTPPAPAQPTTPTK